MMTLDIPQANGLDTVRRVVKAISLGAHSIEEVADFTTFSTRHTGYRLHAARILGLINFDGDRLSLRAEGESLLETEISSTEERTIFFKAIESSAVIQLIAPELLTLCPPSIEEIRERLFGSTKLSRETAERRAGTLMAWRRYVMGQTIPARTRPPKAMSAPKTQSKKTDSKKPIQLSLF